VGISIFGRQFNTLLPKHLRKPLCKNTLRRIAGGIRKQYPDFYQFLCKYHGGERVERSYSLDAPINTVDTSNRFQLVTVEDHQFIQDHCQTDNYQQLDGPLRVQLTRQTKQLITLEKIEFLKEYFKPGKNKSKDKAGQSSESDNALIVQYYGGGIQSNSLGDPLNTVTCRDTHQLLIIEKLQFIAKYFNSNGSPESNTESLDDPISPILTKNKHQLITILENLDIKARFLRADELAACSTFPRDYFNHPELKLSQKSAIQLIGNAVPPMWAKVLIEPNIETIKNYKRRYPETDQDVA
jgi:DNA (cytosine-5)-methyltransferase 1